jgi:hypothetical protein
MCLQTPIRIPRGVILSLATAWMLSAGGCTLFPASEPAEPRASDTLGKGLRGIPVTTAPTDRKQPFWEKYRDKRVQQIDRNLGVEEPAGW